MKITPECVDGGASLPVSSGVSTKITFRQARLLFARKVWEMILSITQKYIFIVIFVLHIRKKKYMISSNMQVHWYHYLKWEDLKSPFNEKLCNSIGGTHETLKLENRLLRKQDKSKVREGSEKYGLYTKRSHNESYGFLQSNLKALCRQGCQRGMTITESPFILYLCLK